MVSGIKIRCSYAHASYSGSGSYSKVSKKSSRANLFLEGIQRAMFRGKMRELSGQISKQRISKKRINTTLSAALESIHVTLSCPAP